MLWKMPLEFQIEGQWKRPKRTQKKQVVQECMKVDLSREDILCRFKWIVGDIQIATRLRCIWSLSFVEDMTLLKTLVSCTTHCFAVHMHPICVLSFA